MRRNLQGKGAASAKGLWQENAGVGDTATRLCSRSDGWAGSMRKRVREGAVAQITRWFSTPGAQ